MNTPSRLSLQTPAHASSQTPARPSPQLSARPSSQARARLAAAVTAAALVASALAACSPSSDQPPAPPSSADDVTTGVPEEPITLTAAYCDAHPVEDLLDGFTALHPNVTFDKQYEECGNFSTDIINRMSSDSAPDITQYVDSAIQTLAPAGHVLDLGAYVEAYGWADKFPADQLAMLQLSADGKVHGEGAQYGIPGGAAFTGVFFNKDLLDQLGVGGPPSTFAEFEEMLAAAKERGMTPLALGSLDDGGIHLWGGMLASMMGADKAKAWVNGTAGATIAVPEAAEAAAKLAEWSVLGYFPGSANGMKEDDARADFAGRGAVFTVDGSWAVGTVRDGLGVDAGFFGFPGRQSSDPASGQGFCAGFAISSRSEKADVAAAFLDYLASPEAAEIAVGLGMLPVNIATAPQPEPGVATELREAYAAAAADGGIVTFFDHATPTMHTELTQGLQGVIAGEVEPQYFVKALQDNWDASKQ